MKRIVAQRNRLAAFKSGKTKYVGTVCKRGHDGIRWVSTSTCVECVRENQKRWIAKRKAAGLESPWQRYRRKNPEAARICKLKSKIKYHEERLAVLNRRLAEMAAS